MTDRHRLLRIVQRHDPAIYSGAYVTCVFNPDKALCLPRRGGTADHPVLGDCRPLDCSNVALTAANITAFHTEITEIEGHLAARPALPPLLQQRLTTRRQEITGFLDRYTPENQ